MAKGKKKKATTLKVKRIILQEDSLLNQHTIERLEHLFTLAPPRVLRNSINYIFFQYLFYAEDACNDSEFKSIVEDFYLLQNFLGEVEGEEETANKPK